MILIYFNESAVEDIRQSETCSSKPTNSSRTFYFWSCSSGFGRHLERTCADEKKCPRYCLSVQMESRMDELMSHEPLEAKCVWIRLTWARTQADKTLLSSESKPAANRKCNWVHLLNYCTQYNSEATLHQYFSFSATFIPQHSRGKCNFTPLHPRTLVTSQTTCTISAKVFLSKDRRESGHVSVYLSFVLHHILQVNITFTWLYF